MLRFPHSGRIYGLCGDRVFGPQYADVRAAGCAPSINTRTSWPGAGRRRVEGVRISLMERKSFWYLSSGGFGRHGLPRIRDGDFDRRGRTCKNAVRQIVERFVVCVVVLRSGERPVPPDSFASMTMGRRARRMSSSSAEPERRNGFRDRPFNPLAPLAAHGRRAIKLSAAGRTFREAAHAPNDLRVFAQTFRKGLKRS